MLRYGCCCARTIRRPESRSLTIMFVLELTYTAPVERVDALMREHLAWLDEQYAAGVFIASGRKNPGTAE